jgi:uncharacterized caspase-like protein
MLEDGRAAGDDWEVHALIGPDATERAVETALDEVFAGPVRENDLVYFFFAGHGRVNPLNQRDVRLMVYDSDPQHNRAGISYAEFRRVFFDSNAGYAVAFIDACRSGAIDISRGSGRPDQDLLGGVQEHAPTKVIITSGSGPQRAFEDPDLGHGVFTYYLRRGLAGEAADKDTDVYVDLGELDDFLRREVAEYTTNNSRMARQTPMVWYGDNLNSINFPLAIRN